MNEELIEAIEALADELDIDIEGLNNIQMIALKRVVEIRYSSARIQAKIDAGHHRAEDLKKRLAEYDKSIDALEIELKTGCAHKVKGNATEGGVTVDIPLGALKMGGLG